MNLSKRLSLIASFVPQDSDICDVGTDHGHLPIYLRQSGRARSVIATDIRALPLSNANKNIEKSGVSNIDTRLCDGLSAVAKGEADTIIIAGMGGEVITKIISDCCWLAEKPAPLLILQPTTSAEALREYLCKARFDIISETAVQENGKLYSVMRCRFTGHCTVPHEYYYFTGKINCKDQDGSLYIKKQFDRFDRCARALEKIPQKHNEYLHFKLLAENISKLLEPEKK